MRHDEIHMDNFDGSPNRLLLGGYISMIGAGFGVPCYGVSRLPNQWYVASCSPAGDPDGKVAGFIPSEMTDVRTLDDHAMRSIGVGEPWVDVFVWEGKPYVGTRSQLWAALQPVRDNIAREAPLTAADLAFGADEAVRRKFARAGVDFLRKRYGKDHARDWRRQVARTRFLTRLLQAGITIRPDIFEVASAAPGAALSIYQPEWASLAEPEQEAVLRAAMATASELDLKLDASRALFPAAFSARGGAADEKAQPPQGPEQTLPRHEAAGLSILILTAGRRAEKIAKAAKLPDWAPDWSEAAGLRSQVMRKGQGSELAWLPWFEICEAGDQPISKGYGAVVVLADDVVADRPSELADLVKYARSLAASHGIVLVAPALPEDAPPRMLTRDLGDLGFGVDLILDTSLARSPLWGVSDRLSLDRRVADLILTAADACLPGSRIHTSITGHSGLSDIPRLASLALWRPEVFSDAYDGAAALTSECNRPHPSGAWLDEPIPMRSSRGAAPAARLVVGRLSPNFADYAHGILMSSTIQGKSRRERYDRAPVSRLRSLMASLEHPAAVAGFAIENSKAGRLALIAETPSVGTLELARDDGWMVARVTDFSGIRRLSEKGAHHEDRIPTEVSLPDLRRFEANRKLATRGVDPRDIVRVPIASELGDALRGHARIAPHVRTYLPGPDVIPDELAIPIEVLEPMARHERLAAELLTRYRSRAQTGRRLADLAVLWRPPLFNRYLLQDGELPPKVLEFDGLRETPVQTCFAIDGDLAVPLLFGSSAFAVWARLTRSRGTGWAKRFAVSKTFETFPILAPFYTTSSTPTGALALMLERDHPLQQLGELLQARNIADVAYRRDGETYRSARETADAAILGLYGLKPEASELTIARRLLTLNGSGVGGEEIHHDHHDRTYS